MNNFKNWDKQPDEPIPRAPETPREKIIDVFKLIGFWLGLLAFVIGSFLLILAGFLMLLEMLYSASGQ